MCDNCCSLKENKGFMLLQVLPVLMMTVVLVVAAITCYRQCILVMLRHNTVLEAYEAALVYNVSLQDLPEGLGQSQAQFRFERTEEEMSPGLVRVEVRVYAPQDDKLLANVQRFEVTPHEK